jgi:hypothetical protein
MDSSLDFHKRRLRRIAWLQINFGTTMFDTGRPTDNLSSQPLYYANSASSRPSPHQHTFVARPMQQVPTGGKDATKI